MLRPGHPSFFKDGRVHIKYVPVCPDCRPHAMAIEPRLMWRSDLKLQHDPRSWNGTGLFPTILDKHIPFIFFWGALRAASLTEEENKSSANLRGAYCHSQRWPRANVAWSWDNGGGVARLVNLFLFRNGAVDHHDHTSFLSMTFNAHISRT